MLSQSQINVNLLRRICPSYSICLQREKECKRTDATAPQQVARSIIVYTSAFMATFFTFKQKLIVERL